MFTMIKRYIIKNARQKMYVETFVTNWGDCFHAISVRMTIAIPIIQREIDGSKT